MFIRCVALVVILLIICPCNLHFIVKGNDFHLFHLFSVVFRPIKMNSIVLISFEGEKTENDNIMKRSHSLLKHEWGHRAIITFTFKLDSLIDIYSNPTDEKIPFSFRNRKQSFTLLVARTEVSTRVDYVFIQMNKL